MGKRFICVFTVPNFAVVIVPELVYEQGPAIVARRQVSHIIPFWP